MREENSCRTTHTGGVEFCKGHSLFCNKNFREVSYYVKYKKHV